MNSYFSKTLIQASQARYRGNIGFQVLLKTEVQTFEGIKKGPFGLDAKRSLQDSLSATRLSWPYGFRPVVLRHRLWTVLPLK